MGYEVVIHDEAREAILQAADYLDLISSGPGAAKRLIETLDDRIGDMSDNPGLYGISRMPELADLGYHATLVTSYVMLYYLSDDVVHIAWFFHQSQDYARYVT